MWLNAVAGGLLAALVATSLHAAQGAKATIWQAGYANADADAGERAYKDKCSYCHREDLSGGGDEHAAPPLAGPQFLRRWRDRSVAEFLVKIGVTMPLTAPQTLTPEQSRELVSYIFRVNRVPPREKQLPLDESLQEIVITDRPE